MITRLDSLGNTFVIEPAKGVTRKVKMNGKYIGTISQNTYGFRYNPKNSPLSGEYYTTLNYCIESLLVQNED